MWAVELAKQYKSIKYAVLEWIDELRYSDFVITNEIMSSSYKYSGISSSLDESEDDQFRGNKD